MLLELGLSFSKTESPVEKMEKGPITINVGGKTFTATRSTWERSPLIKMLLERDETVFIDRNPVVFDHVLDWLRTGKLYIKKDNITYRRLRDDAEFYLLDDLSAYLDDRLNLYHYVAIELIDGHGTIKLMFNMSAFKSIKPANGHLDKLVSEGISEARYLTSNDEFILLVVKNLEYIFDRDAIRALFAAPHIEHTFVGTRERFHESLKFLFGSRIQVLKESRQNAGFYMYSVFDLKYSPEPYL